MPRFYRAFQQLNKKTKEKKENAEGKWARIKAINRQFSETHMPHN